MSSKKPKAADGAPKVDKRVFEAPVFTWRIQPKHKGRQYVVLTMPFAEAYEWFEVRKYDDKTGQGEQREKIKSHVAALKRDMLDDNFTPAGWSAGLRPSHKKDLVIQDGVAKITISSNNRLPKIDGGHRGHAMQELLEDALNRDDQPLVAAIRECHVTIQVHLDPDRLKTDFLNLQKSRPVNKAQQRSMAVRAHAITDPKKYELMKFAYELARALNNNKDSHLFGQISFDSSDKSPLSVYSLTTPGGSELATSLYGTALIAQSGNMDVKWATDTMIEAYHAIEEFAETMEVEDDLGNKETVVKLLNRNSPLCPKGPHGGSKGGSSLLIGLGNMLAWRKLAISHAKATKEDYENLARVAGDVFDHTTDDIGGLSAPYKRKVMGDVARLLNADIVVNRPSEAVEGKFGSDEGVPQPLTKLLSRSTFGIRGKRSQLAQKAAALTSTEEGLYGGEVDLSSVEEEDSDLDGGFGSDMEEEIEAEPEEEIPAGGNNRFERKSSKKGVPFSS